MVSGNRPILQTVGTDQLPETFVGSVGKSFQPFFYENTVFSLKIHDISYCGNGPQFQKVLQLFFRNTAGFIESCHKLQGNHCPAESFFRIVTIRLFWIYNGVGRRKDQLSSIFRFFIGNLMMIGYDHCHSFFLCHRNFIVCCNPVITGNNYINPVIHCSFNQVLMDSISISHPVRNVCICQCTYSLQSFDQDKRGHYTINIIVSNNTDTLFFFYLVSQDLHCFIHIFH